MERRALARRSSLRRKEIGHNFLSSMTTNPDLALESLGARARRFAFPVPDALLALMYAAVAADMFFPFLPQTARQSLENGLGFALLVEGAFLFMQGTLVDVATRLKKRPPLWLIPFILGGVLLTVGGMSGGLEVLKMAWNAGSVAFLPLVLSLLERGVMLWQMPSRTVTQKYAARALVSNRITTGLALVALLVVTIAATTLLDVPLGGSGAWPIFVAGALYFGIAAWDDARVKRPAFAANPRVLFRYDFIDVKHLDPL
jgi:hypothetical protein